MPKSLAELMAARKAAVPVQVPLGDGTTYDFSVRYDPDKFTVKMARELSAMSSSEEDDSHERSLNDILGRMLTAWDLEDALTPEVINGLTFWVKLAVGNAVMGDWNEKFLPDSGKAKSAEGSSTP